MKRLALAALMLSTPLTALAQNATVGVPAVLNGNPVTILIPYTPNGDGTYSPKIAVVSPSGGNLAQETGGNLALISGAINNPLAAQTGNGVLIGATQGTETGGTGTTANKVGIQGCSTCVPVPVTGSSAALLGTTNGWTPQRLSALSTTVVSIKASAGQLGMLQCYNPNSSQAYVQIFNVASGSVTLGTTSPTLSIPIAPLSTGGYALPNPGINFSTAIAIAATTTAAGSTANSTAVDCNVAFN